MPERLSLRQIPSPKDALAPETKTQGFVPEPIHVNIPGVFEGYISVLPIQLEHVGSLSILNFKVLADEPYKTFRDYIVSEVARSLAGTRVPDDQSEIVSGMPYDEVHKKRRPITEKMIKGKRRAAKRILARHSGQSEEMVNDLRRSSLRYISEAQRKNYVDNMMRTKKYAVRGSGQGGEILYYWNPTNNTIDLQIVTTKRPYAGYRLFAKPELPEEVKDLGDILGTVTTLATGDGQYLVLKRSDENFRYKGPGLFGGMFDDQGAPISNDAVARNSSEEIFQELGIHSSQLTRRQITSISHDSIAPHGEITERAFTNLTSDELIPIIDANAKKPESRPNESREVDYFFMPRTSAALKTLLVDIRCLFPPTHIAGLLADSGLARFEERLRFYSEQESTSANSVELAYNDAKDFLLSLVPGITENFMELNRIAKEHWVNNPSAWQELIERERQEAQRNNVIPFSRPSTPPDRYDPTIRDEDQGIDKLRKQLLEKGLATEDKLHGPILGSPD